MAEVIRYVDTDVSGGTGDGTSWENAYANLATWEAGEETDLVTDDDWHHCYTRASSGSADPSVTNILGWTTDSTHYILIENADNHQGKWNTSVYRIARSDAAAIIIREEYIRFKGLQISNYGLTAVGKNIIFWSTGGYGGEIWFEKCIIKGDNNDTYYQDAVILSDLTTVVKMWNTVIFDIPDGSGNGNCLAVYLNCAAGTIIENCTISGGYYGLRCIEAESVTVTNVIVVDNETDGFVGTFHPSSDYNCSDRAGDAPGANSQNGADPSFVDKANGDFHLQSGDTVAKDNGTSSVSLGFTDDIDGQTRTGDWDIGADEYVSGGQQYYQSAAGNFAPTGILIKNAKTTKAGSLTLTGIILKKGFVPKTGTLTFSGSATSFAKKSLSGVLSFSGSIAKNIKTALEGSFDFAGSLFKKGYREISGIFSATGALNAALLKLKSVGGIFAPTGVLKKNTKTVKAGSLTLTGSIVKKGFVAVVGSLTFSGFLDAVLPKLKSFMRGLSIPSAKQITAAKVVAAKEPMEPKINGVQEATKPKIVIVE